MDSVYSQIYKAYSLEELVAIKKEREEAYRQSLLMIDEAIIKMQNHHNHREVYEALCKAELHVTPLCKSEAKVGRPREQCSNDMSLDEIRNRLRLQVPAESIANRLGISRATFYRRMKNTDYVPGDVMFSELLNL